MALNNRLDFDGNRNHDPDLGIFKGLFIHYRVSYGQHRRRS